MKRKSFLREYLIDFLQSSIIEGKKLLIIGGDIMEDVINLKPSYSVELFDVKGNSSSCPPNRYANTIYQYGSIADIETGHLFDYVIFYLSLNYENDLYNVFFKLKKLMHRDSKVFIIGTNSPFLFIINLFNRLRLIETKPEKNVLNLADLENLINIFGFDILDTGYRCAFPFRMLGLENAMNYLFPRIKLLRNFCFVKYVSFRLHPDGCEKQNLSCSIVIPCYNEQDNIAECISRIPEFGSWREIIIVNDGSYDNTENISRELTKHRKDVRFISYSENRGKGYAINMGWQEAKGDVFMTLDCDCTTPPEELILFHDAMERGAEFINGSRIIYKRENNSILFLNRLGVSFFAHLISWIIQKRISDPFCGTKVFLRKHRDCFKITELLWGDWDLFFNAAKYKLKMLELPIHYKARRHGKTKMKPIKHGLILFFKAFAGLRIVK